MSAAAAPQPSTSDYGVSDLDSHSNADTDTDTRADLPPPPCPAAEGKRGAQPQWTSALELQECKAKASASARDAASSLEAELGGLPLAPSAYVRKYAATSTATEAAPPAPLTSLESITSASASASPRATDELAPVAAADSAPAPKPQRRKSKWVPPPQEPFYEFEDSSADGDDPVASLSSAAASSASSHSFDSMDEDDEDKDKEVSLSAGKEKEEGGAKADSHLLLHRLRAGRYEVLLPASIRATPGGDSLRAIDPPEEVVLTGQKQACPTDPSTYYAELSPTGWIRLLVTKGPVVRRVLCHPGLAEGLRSHPLHQHKKHKHRHRRVMGGVIAQAAREASSKLLQAKQHEKHKRRLSAIIRQAASKGATHPEVYEQKQATKKRLSMVLLEVATKAGVGDIDSVTVPHDAPESGRNCRDSHNCEAYEQEQENERDLDSSRDGHSLGLEADGSPPPPPPPSAAHSIATTITPDRRAATHSHSQGKSHMGGVSASAIPFSLSPLLAQERRDRSESIISALTVNSASPSHSPRQRGQQRSGPAPAGAGRHSPSPLVNRAQARSVHELATTPGKGRTQGVAANVLRNMLRGLREKDMADLAIQDLRDLVSTGQAVVGLMPPAVSRLGRDFDSDTHSVFSEEPVCGYGTTRKCSDLTPRKKELLMDHGRYSPDKTHASFAPNSLLASVQESKKAAAKQQQQHRPSWTKHFVSDKL